MRGLDSKLADERAFTLIELLVVILIIGILAAIAIPSFLNQKNKATAAQAKELARTAETTAETYSTDHGGTYEGMTAAILREYEPSIVTTKSSKEAYLVSATPTASPYLGYTVIAEGTEGTKFKITRAETGEVTRTCEPVKVGTGCSSGDW
jgi:type IV pilus assembly protein PilA